MESAVCRKIMFYMDETLVEGCSCEAKSNAPRIHNVSKIVSQKKKAFGVDETRQFCVLGLSVTLGHHQPALPCSAPFGLALPPKRAFGVDSRLSRLLASLKDPRVQLEERRMLTELGPAWCRFQLGTLNWHDGVASFGKLPPIRC